MRKKCERCVQADLLFRGKEKQCEWDKHWHTHTIDIFEAIGLKQLGGGSKYVLLSPRKLRKMSNLTTVIFFSDGLVQPPTRTSWSCVEFEVLATIRTTLGLRQACPPHYQSDQKPLVVGWWMMVGFFWERHFPEIVSLTQGQPLEMSLTV